MADVASSSIKSLLCLRIALARAMICLWPTERLAPPPAIFVSNVILLFSSTCCWREKSPAERKASFMVASSYCPKGSTLCRRVPLISSGYGMTQYYVKAQSIEAYRLGDDSDVRTESIKCGGVRWNAVVRNETFCWDAAK